MKLCIATVVLLCLAPFSWAERAIVAGPVGPDGTEIACDLPTAEHMKNVGGRDGAGLCVFTSVEHSGRWQNAETLRGFQQKMRAELGGGYPEKLDRMMGKYAADVKYVQYSGNDPSILDLAIKTGRMPSVTYGYSERYGGRVAHMVNLVHLDQKWGVVLDNNFPGSDKLEWMSRGEFLRRWQLGGGGWAVVLLDPSPPPIPVNAQPVQAVYSSWGPSGCGPVGPEVSPVSQSSYEWRKLPGDLSRQYLYKDGKQVAGYDFTTGVFRWYDAAKDSWSEPENPPWKEPVGGALANFGVALERIPKTDAGAYWLNGVLASAQSVQQAIENRSLADDSAKLRLTLIGSKARCDQVQADLQTHPALAPFRDKFLIQSYRPGHWATDVFKLPPGQEFYLSVQTAADVKGKGIELHAQDYYAGPELLAAGLSEAQRRADPNYDPKKTPDVTKPKPKPDDPAASNQTLLLIGGLILCVVLFLLGNNRDDLN